MRHRNPEDRFDAADDDRRFERMIEAERKYKLDKIEMERKRDACREYLQTAGWYEEIRYVIQDLIRERGMWRVIGGLHWALYGGQLDDGTMVDELHPSFDELATGLQLYKDQPETFDSIKRGIMRAMWLTKQDAIGNKPGDDF